jgi:hypothetical protein
MNLKCILLILISLLFLLSSRLNIVHAVTITEDPQFIVMNFSTINDLDWTVPEAKWNSEVKPVILQELHDLEKALPKGTDKRKLAWSTLEEYMNYPMDTPSKDSAYAIKMRRILEIAESEDLPVFLPLNGFQWWDELPELYNWWDPDGTHTPEAFFKRQKTKDFKERFIKGYNPDNKWNVEWQDYQTPMQLNSRNWGGGGFFLAPPPNLLQNTRAKNTYRDVLEARLRILLEVLDDKLNVWEQEKKLYLFAGLTIGTEVSLNASVSPDEFNPYGYRGIQDLLCPNINPTCGTEQKWSFPILDQARQDVLKGYLSDLSEIAVSYGIPKQRIYTHVWAETEPGSPNYATYAPAAFNLYSRPGLSLYGFSQDPYALPQWRDALKNNGYPAWGGVEFSIDKVFSLWQKGLNNTFNSNPTPAKIIAIYNWSENKNTEAIPALKQFLDSEPKTPDCELPEIIPQDKNFSYAPKELSWNLLGLNTKIQTSYIHMYQGLTISDNLPQSRKGLESNTTTYSTVGINPGNHTWLIEDYGCGVMHQFSQPMNFYIPFAEKKLTVSENFFLFVETLLKKLNLNYKLFTNN